MIDSKRTAGIVPPWLEVTLPYVSLVAIVSYIHKNTICVPRDKIKAAKSNGISLIVLLVLVWVSASSQAQTVRYIHTDALGSPVSITNINGQVVERREYEPYGEQLLPSASDGPGYTGHVQDPVTGLMYMQQRYYDPGIGRFLSVDPVNPDSVTGGNFNRYGYANNNPYRFKDPDGRRATVVNGQIVIIPENPGNPNVTIPNTVGATGVSPERWFFHDYSVATSSITRNPQAVASAFAKNPAPGPNDYATPQGTLNNVGHLPLQLDFGVNMVRSFTAASPDPARFTDVTVNYTVAGAHSMEEGFVLQFGRIGADGSITNVSYGEGNAFLQGNWDKPVWLPQVKAVWEKHHNEINQAAEGQ